MADFTIRDNVGLISMNHPPVNSLSVSVRQALYQHLKTAERNNKISAIIICGKGGSFCGGADITEFGKKNVENSPNLLELIHVIENCTKPVIAAVHGYALGGGLEVTLGCHFRVALTSAKFGFPEVNLGILPAAGGTQRFSRLVGLQHAIDWITSGKHYTAQEAAMVGMLDRLYPDSNNLIENAIQFSKTLSNRNLATRRISLLSVKDASQVEKLVAAKKEAFAEKSRGALAPYVCLQATANSVLPYSKGLKKESELFTTLVSSGQSQALRYAFFAERLVAKWSAPNGVNYKNSKPMKLNKLAVIGLGTMGSGIAISFSTIGLPVYVFESSDEVLAKSVRWVYGIIDRMAKRGEITSEQCKAMQTNLKPCNSYSQLKDADLVVEAVFENLKLKEEIFRKLDMVCKPSTILASNTSSFDIEHLAAQTRRPGKVVGMHFFAPSHRMRLLENVRTTLSSPQSVATIMDLGKKINHVPVLVGNCSGFAANRMYLLYVQESDFLLEEGAYPEQVDKAMRDFGMVMGRYETADLSGNDVMHRVRRENKNEEKAKEQNLRYCRLTDIICEHGRYGVKTDGKGWYKLAGRKFEVDPDVTKLIDDYRKQNNITPRKIFPEEILERMLFCMVNEGFKLMEEGIASAPHDLDMIWIYGFSFPKHTGGPMYYAYTVGLPRVLEMLESRWQRFGKSEPHWKPSSMLINLVKNHGNPHISQWVNLSREVVQSNL